jgi:hypothetical protein
MIFTRASSEKLNTSGTDLQKTLAGACRANAR